MTPARAVEAIRVDAAKRALEETDERMPQIARCCGFTLRKQERHEGHEEGTKATKGIKARFARP